MIVAFTNPHKIGSVCLQPCKQCGETLDQLLDMTDGHGLVTPPAMKIIREATRQEHEDFARSVGATLPFRLPSSTSSTFYYEVQTD